MLPVISAIVFDFDGVLVDSEPLHLRSYQEVLEPVGLSLPREKYYSSYLGYDDAGVFKAIAEAREWPLDEQKLRALIDEKCRVFEALKSDGTGGDMLYPGRGGVYRSPRGGVAARDCVRRGPAGNRIDTSGKWAGSLLPLHRRGRRDASR